MNRVQAFVIFYQIVYLAMACTLTIVFFKSGILLVVNNDDMKPEIRQGDVILSTGPDYFKPLQIGDIVNIQLPHLMNSTTSGCIITRIIEIDFTNETMMTKRDNNNYTDESLYSPSFTRLPKNAILSKVYGKIQKIGWITIAFSSIPATLRNILAIIVLLAYSWFESRSSKSDNVPSSQPSNKCEWITFIICPFV